ncbi:MAG: hypothetical protein KF819_11010 [Labilithrix sp.]|nr:hypothetical protein [Labilithrix sp.]
MKPVAVVAVVLGVVMTVIGFVTCYVAAWLAFAYGAQLVPITVGSGLWLLLGLLVVALSIVAIRSNERRARRLAIIALVVAFGGSLASCPAGLALGSKYNRLSEKPFPEN